MLHRRAPDEFCLEGHAPRPVQIVQGGQITSLPCALYLQSKAIVTSIGYSSLATSMRDSVVDTLLRSRTAKLSLAGEHSRTGESSKCRAVSAKTAKMNIGHFRVERQNFIAMVQLLNEPLDGF